MKPLPNHFFYATKELSQDAFICWLLAWSDPVSAGGNPDLHRCSSRPAGCRRAQRQIADMEATREEARRLAALEVARQQEQWMACLAERESAMQILADYQLARQERLGRLGGTGRVPRGTCRHVAWNAMDLKIGHGPIRPSRREPRVRRPHPDTVCG